MRPLQLKLRVDPSTVTLGMLSMFTPSATGGEEGQVAGERNVTVITGSECNFGLTYDSDFNS